LGVRIQAVTPEIADSLGLDKPRGALIASVSENGPAAAAKIQPGDVVLSFDGKDITDMRRLPRSVAETTIGKKSDVVVWRKGQEVKTHVVVGELPDKDDNDEPSDPKGKGETNKAPNPASAQVLGMTLIPLTDEARGRLKLEPDTKGVLVEAVQPHSPAAERGIQSGDVVLEGGQQDITSPQLLLDKVQEAQKQGKKSLLLLINRSGDLRFVAIKLDQKPKP
jgi:serine protease Do